MKNNIIGKDLGFRYLKKNPGIAVNVFFSNKKNQNIYTARMSEHKVKCKKQVNLLMIVDGEKRHYTAIKSISRLLSKLNGKPSAHITFP